MSKQTFRDQITFLKKKSLKSAWVFSQALACVECMCKKGHPDPQWGPRAMPLVGDQGANDSNGHVEKVVRSGKTRNVVDYRGFEH